MERCKLPRRGPDGAQPPPCPESFYAWSDKTQGEFFLQKICGVERCHRSKPKLTPPPVSTPVQARQETADTFKMRYALRVLSVCFFVHSLYSVYTCTFVGVARGLGALGPNFQEVIFLIFAIVPSVLTYSLPPTLYQQFYELMQHTIVTVLVHKSVFQFYSLGFILFYCICDKTDEQRSV